MEYGKIDHAVTDMIMLYYVKVYLSWVERVILSGFEEWEQFDLWQQINDI